MHAKQVWGELWLHYEINISSHFLQFCCISKRAYDLMHYCMKVNSGINIGTGIGISRICYITIGYQNIIFISVSPGNNLEYNYKDMYE